MHRSSDGETPLNLVVYAYRKSGGQSWLTDIFDTTPVNDPTTPNLSSFAHHTHLRWQVRPDQTESYRSGWLMRSTLRLLGVDVSSKTYANASSGLRHQVRRYHLGYDETLHRSVLTGVVVEGRCGVDRHAISAEGSSATEDGQGLLPAARFAGEIPLTAAESAADECLLPPMAFGYTQVQGRAPNGQPQAGLSGYQPFNGESQFLSNSPDHSLDEGLTDLFDINSDGLPDVLVSAPGLYGTGQTVFFNGENLKIDSINNGKLYPKFTCEPYTPEQAET